MLPSHPPHHNCANQPSRSGAFWPAGEPGRAGLSRRSCMRIFSVPTGFNKTRHRGHMRGYGRPFAALPGSRTQGFCPASSVQGTHCYLRAQCTPRTNSSQADFFSPLPGKKNQLVARKTKRAVILSVSPSLPREAIAVAETSPAVPDAAGENPFRGHTACLKSIPKFALWRTLRPASESSPLPSFLAVSTMRVR